MGNQSDDSYVSKRTHESIQRVAVDVNIKVQKQKLSKANISAITKAVIEEFRRIGK